MGTGGVLADLGEGFLDLDLRGRVEHVSPRFVATTGYGPEEMVGQHVRRLLVTSGARKAVRRGLRRRRENAEARFEVALVHKDGGRLWLEVELAPLVDASGEPVATRAVFHDVSGRRQAETALRTSELRLHLLLGQVPAIVWTTDRELRFTSGAGSGLAALQVHAEEVLGMSLPDFFGTDNPDFPAIAEHRRAVAGHSTSYDFEWAGNLYRVYLEPLRGWNQRVEGVIGVAVDVTERRKLEKELRRLRELVGSGRRDGDATSSE